MPSSTPGYTKDYDIFEKLEEEIIRYQINKGNVILGGDFNVKTKTESDCVGDQTDSK